MHQSGRVSEPALALIEMVQVQVQEPEQVRVSWELEAGLLARKAVR